MRLDKGVKHLCKLRGWTLRYLNKKSGFVSNYMYRLTENSGIRSPRLNTMQKISDGLGVSILLLLYASLDKDEIDLLPYDVHRVLSAWMMHESKRKSK